MRHIFFLFITLVCLTDVFSQKTLTPSEILTPEQVTELFPDTVRKKFTINFPIVRVYKYSDKAGQYYCVLTESRNVITEGKDTFNHSIKAINIKTNNGSLVKHWEIHDHIANDNEETSIWFWTKYTDFEDNNGDGLVDPIIIYGTSATNGVHDGRIKLLIYYKQQKVAIRHQNGSLDFERKTQVDKTFYQLPESLQSVLKQKIELMMENDHAIFPAGWQTAMKNKKTNISEKITD